MMKDFKVYAVLSGYIHQQFWENSGILNVRLEWECSYWQMQLCPCFDAPLCSTLFQLIVCSVRVRAQCSIPVAARQLASVKHRSQVDVGQRYSTTNVSPSILSPTILQIIYQWIQTPFIDAIRCDLSSINCCLVAKHLGRSRAVFLKNIAGARRTSHIAVDSGDQ